MSLNKCKICFRIIGPLTIRHKPFTFSICIYQHSNHLQVPKSTFNDIHNIRPYIELNLIHRFTTPTDICKLYLNLKMNRTESMMLQIILKTNPYIHADWYSNLNLHPKTLFTLRIINLITCYTFTIIIQLIFLQLNLYNFNF